jgi:glycosyltransferase involved in cell wall biosynthesis
MRGGEKVVEALCRLIPDADIYTLFYNPDNVSPLIRSRHVTASILNPFQRYYRSMLPFMPVALEHLDLRGYDLVISSESGPAKGVLTSSNTRHVCYCHSPMRYLWDLYPSYLHEWTHSRSRRALISILSNYLRLWDFASAARVDDFVANSANVQRRLWKNYRRTSEVIYPPVAIETFYCRPPEEYYLIVSELVSYKRVGDAVRCCSKMRRKLKIVGDGPEYKSLRSIAGPDVDFCGRVSDPELREIYSRCRALLLPGEEDFGIAPVEALASGKPVIAWGRGGVLESVPTENPKAGFFYSEPGETPLETAVKRFEQEEVSISPFALRNSVTHFSEARFASQINCVLSGANAASESSARPAALRESFR